MSVFLMIALAVGAAILVIGGIVTVSMRLTDRKQLRNARGIAEGAPVLGNEWVALGSDPGGSDCGGADGGGGCD